MNKSVKPSATRASKRMVPMIAAHADRVRQIDGDERRDERPTEVRPKIAQTECQLLDHWQLVRFHQRHLIRFMYFVWSINV